LPAAVLLGAAARPETFEGFLAGTTLRPALPVVLAEALPFGLATLVFKALWARAFPAGELLVAGLSRVDFATACLREEGRPLVRRDDREESFFPPFSIELLIPESPHC